MQMLLTSLMTLTLQNTQKMRMIMCTVADTWALPINRPTLSHISTELEGLRDAGQHLPNQQGHRGAQDAGPAGPRTRARHAGRTTDVRSGRPSPQGDRRVPREVPARGPPARTIDRRGDPPDRNRLPT
eukprot:3204579-Pyramimonas_sp.AAC.1